MSKEANEISNFEYDFEANLIILVGFWQEQFLTLQILRGDEKKL